MADFVDRIKLIVDMTTDGASKGMSDFKQSVSEAEGGFGKLKAGAGSAFSFLQDNAGLAAAGAGAAVASFAVKSIAHFEELAISAEDFSTAAGTSVTDASRWLEVASDLGVQSDAVSGAMNRLNREAASGKLAGFGIDATNANDRLIETLQYLASIPNEADRAKAQFDIFGKSGASITPLIANVGELRDRLKEVQGGKLISDSDLTSAKNLRDSMDQLSDDWDSLSLSLAKAFAPAVSGMAELLAKVADLATTKDDGSFWDDVKKGALSGGFNVLNSALGLFSGGSSSAKTAQDGLKQSVDMANKALADQQKAADDANTALQGLLTATLGMFNSQLALTDAGDKAAASIATYEANVKTAAASNWSNKDATDAVATSMDAAESSALKQAAAAAKLAADNATASGSSLTAAESANIQAGVLETLAGTLDPNDPLRANLLAYAHQLESIPASKDTKITADTTDAEAKVKGLAGIIENFVLHPFTVKVNAQTSATGQAASASAPTSSPARALAPVAAPMTPAVLGAPRASTAPGSTVINVNVSAAPLTHPAEIGRQIADYLDAFYRRSGNVSRLTA